MSSKLLLREHPQRALAVLTDSHALIFRHSLSSTGADYGSNNETSTRCSALKCMVEFTARKDVDLDGYRALRVSGVHGTLGLININADVFLCVISGAVRVATGMRTMPGIRLLSVGQLFELYEKFREQKTVDESLQWPPKRADAEYEIAIVRSDETVQRILSVDFCESLFSNQLLGETWESFNENFRLPEQERF